MKALFYFFPAQLYVHYAIRTDLALQHIKNGDDVDFLFFEEFSEESKRKDAYTPYLLPDENAFKTIDIPASKRHFVKFENPDLKSIPEFNNIDDLKDYCIEDIDIGSSVASTIISDLHEARPDLKTCENIYKPMIHKAYSVYKSVYETLSALKPDVFYIYNGRYYFVRPALRAAQKLGIKTIVYETDSEPGKYIFSTNEMLHEINFIKTEIQECWEKYDSTEERENIAKSWFINKRQRKDIRPFAKEQIREKLPENFDNNKINIAIFNNSDYEFEAFDYWKHEFFNNPVFTIKKILESVTDDNIHFYLRVHPNMKDLDNSQIREINSLNYKNLTIIPPESEIDSYMLMDSCNKVLNFGSTVGIEAIFSGKPVILAGKAEYEDLGGFYKAENYDELIYLIKEKELKPLPENDVLKFGYCQKTKGKKLKYFKSHMPECRGFFSFYLADYYYRKGEHSEKVLNEYFQAYSLYNESKENEKGSAYLALLISILRKFIIFYQDYNSALKFAEETVAISPYFAEALFTQAFCYQNIGQYDKAIEIFKKMMTFFSDDKLINPLGIFSDTKSLIPNIYLQIGRCLILNNQNKEGGDYFNNSYQLGGNITVTLHLLKYYLINDDMKNAVPLFIMLNKFNDNQRFDILNISFLPKSDNRFKNLQKSILHYIKSAPGWMEPEKNQIIHKLNDILI